MINLKKIEKQLNVEAAKQMAIIFPATAIALHDYFGWGALKIERFFDEANKVFNESGEGGDVVSLLQMLDEQVGIDLKISQNGKSWREICFLNHEVNLGTKETYNDQQEYMMRVMQLKWFAPATLAAEFIALHRKYRFSKPMLADLMGYIDDIRHQYAYKSGRLAKACYEATGIMMLNGYRKERK